jgi:hypothetical protein
LIG